MSIKAEKIKPPKVDKEKSSKLDQRQLLEVLQAFERGDFSVRMRKDLTGLSGKVGPALDPCAAMQTTFELGDGQEREVVFILGAGRDTAAVQ